MTCVRCGSLLQEGGEICKYCGEKLKQVDVGQVNPAPEAVVKKTYVPSLVLSIVGLVFALLLPLVAYPCLIVGLVLAVRRRATHKTMAATVMCIVGLVVALVNSTIGACMAIADYLYVF